MRRQALVVIGALVVTAALIVPGVILVRAQRGQAAFGAAQRLGTYRLDAGTLDIEVGTRTTPIVVSNIAPGDRMVGSVELLNAGSLPLRYSLSFETSAQPLTGLLSWDIWTASACEPGPSPAEALVSDRRLTAGSVALLGDPASGEDPGDRTIDPGAVELVCFAATMAIDAPDSAQGVASRHELTVAAEHAIESDDS